MNYTIEQVEPIVYVETFPLMAKGPVKEDRITIEGEIIDYEKYKNLWSAPISPQEADYLEFISRHRQEELIKSINANKNRLHIVSRLLNNVTKHSKYKLMKFLFPALAREIEFLSTVLHEQLFRTS